VEHPTDSLCHLYGTYRTLVYLRPNHLHSLSSLWNTPKGLSLSTTTLLNLPSSDLEQRQISANTTISMSCPDCFKGAVHTHAEPKGSMETVYGVSTYVSPAPAGSTSKSTILYICDAFGLNLVNNVSLTSWNAPK
jgi:hypothetical protein